MNSRNLLPCIAVIMSLLSYYGCVKREPRYTIGIQNRTPMTLNNVIATFKPEGEFSCGILSSNNAKYHMDPHWPVPDVITLRFTDEDGLKPYDIQKKVGLSKDFKGELMIEIVKFGDGLDFQIKQQQSAQKKE